MKTAFDIEGIPALLWGHRPDKLFIAVHGDRSHKEDAVLALFAEEAAAKGWGMVSFDLPEHGEREGDPYLCNARNCVRDLKKVMTYARRTANDIALFGCSIGAYFGMLALKDEPIRQALFLSPVVDMKRIIDNIMTWFGIGEERLKLEGEIATPARTLYWDYYAYVLEHPVKWDKPTSLLCGGEDDLCEFDIVSEFAARSHADVTVLESAGHYFHTEEELVFFRQWLRDKIS